MNRSNTANAEAGARVVRCLSASIGLVYDTFHLGLVNARVGRMRPQVSQLKLGLQLLIRQ